MTMFGQDDEAKRADLEQELEDTIRAMLKAGFTVNGVRDSMEDALDVISDEK